MDINEAVARFIQSEARDRIFYSEDHKQGYVDFWAVDKYRSKADQLKFEDGVRKIALTKEHEDLALDTVGDVLCDADISLLESDPLAWAMKIRELMLDQVMKTLDEDEIAFVLRTELDDQDAA